MRHPAVIALLLLALAIPPCVIGCKHSPRPSSGTLPKYYPVPGRTSAEPLAKADVAFGLELFRKLTKAQPRQNVFVSPASVAMALAMAYNGAAGDTKAAMAKALELGGMTADSLNRANQALVESLAAADSGLTLRIANSIWANKDAEFSDAFASACMQFYGARPATLDFGNPRSAQTINDWVSRKTEGKIPQMMSSEKLREWAFLLLDAAYFHGEWSDKFKRSQTRDGPFALLDKTHKTVPMMRRSGSYWYAKTAQFEAILLPYGRGRLGMYVFLPGEKTDLAAFCAALTGPQWNAALEQFESERDGSITLPRFRAEYEARLDDALSALGMGIAFDNARADFGPMHKGGYPLWIDEVLHKTFVEVDEEGTEAAAATHVGMTKGPAPPPSSAPFNMVVDRPFFCAICDDQTKTVLFVGAIVDPGNGELAAGR